MGIASETGTLRATIASALHGKLKKGESASGEAAKALKPNVTGEFARYGL